MDDAPRPSRRDRGIAIGTGLLLTAVALMGADRPPPPGFLAVVVVAGALSVLIAFALPRWRAARAPHRLTRGPAAQGALVGALIWLIFYLLPFSGEPSITPSVGDHLIGVGVSVLLGAGGAWLLARIARRPE